jgi:hypothetical protein
VDPYNERLQKAILTVVEQQIRENEPTVTGAAYRRLREEGSSDEEAKRLIGFVVGAEFFSVLSQERKYDATRFAAMLDALPKLPWELPEGGI